ncbi:alpha/beta fold hydrolase [Streptomyces sp. NPDC007002]|uniref:alpha/beta fold hydrolase n=1 Tax=Streptomyces sp. NPDC007002 TaxID=3156910 RepID=UPI0034511569
MSYLPSRIRPTMIAVAVPLLLLVGACTPSTSDASQQAKASKQPPTELDRFYEQNLAFGSCKGYGTTPADEKAFANPRFQCARLRVPLDYSDPEGKTAQIAVLRVPARGKSKGPLLLNSGGPGGTGQNFAVQTDTALAESPVTERFDLVGFDPRGVGASKPAISCFSKEDYLAGDVRTELVLTAGRFSEDSTRRLVSKCVQGSGGEQHLGSVSTRDTVRDMDILRSALGGKKMNFLGQSYGTRIGALYAQQFPGNVRTMVLDGAVDPHLGSERRLSQYSGFQRSFDKMAEACATAEDCPLGTDPKQATEEFQKIARPLLDKPIAYGEGMRFTYNNLIDSVISGLYYQAVWPKITKGLAEVRSGNPEQLLAITAAFSGRGPDGSGGNFDVANYAITCMDEARMTPEQAVDMRGRTYKAAPFVDPGTGTEGARDACEFWPAEPKTTYPFPDRVDGLPPTLTISITGDPSTPHAAGVNLAKTLDGSLLTVKGEQHTVAASGSNACVNEALANYLIHLRTPAETVTCTL